MILGDDSFFAHDLHCIHLPGVLLLDLKHLAGKQSRLTVSKQGCWCTTSAKGAHICMVCQFYMLCKVTDNVCHWEDAV